MPQKLFKLILLYTDRTVTKHTQLQAEMRKVPSMLYLTIQCTKAIFILDEPVLCLREMKKVIEKHDFASL